MTVQLGKRLAWLTSNLTAPGDIGERGHCRALAERALAELGRLDVLVNNVPASQQSWRRCTSSSPATTRATSAARSSARWAASRFTEGGGVRLEG